jgi:hypothetical protein
MCTSRWWSGRLTKSSAPLQQVAQLVRPGTEALSKQGQDHDASKGQAQIRICVDHCASLDSSAGAVTAFVVAFAGSVALWWI